MPRCNNYCCVLGCTNNSNKQPHLSFFSIPKRWDRMKKWFEVIGRTYLLTTAHPHAYRVCSVHFEPHMLINKRLNSVAVPSLHLPERSDAPTSDSIPAFGIITNVTSLAVAPTVEPETSPTAVTPKVELDITSPSTVVTPKDEPDSLPNTVTPKIEPEIEHKDEYVHTLTPFISHCYYVAAEPTSEIKIESDDKQVCTIGKPDSENVAMSLALDDKRTNNYNSVQTGEDIFQLAQTIEESNTSGANISLSAQNIELTGEGSNYTACSNQVLSDTNLVVTLPNGSFQNEFVQTLNESLNPNTTAKRKLESTQRLRKKRKISDDSNVCSPLTGEKNISTSTIRRENEMDPEIFIEQFMKWRKNLIFKYSGFDYEEKLMLMTLNMYLKNPRSRSFFGKCFSLPSIRTIQNININFETGVNADVIKVLSERLTTLPVNYKRCLLLLDETPLTKELRYNDNNDEIIGFQEIDGERSEEIATKALVMMLKGCVEKFQQPLGYAFTGTTISTSTTSNTNNNTVELNEWLVKTIEQLFDSGFEVCAVVTKQKPTFINLAKFKHISVQHPYFHVDEKMVVYMYDVPHLMKCLRNDMLACDFIYNSKLVSWSFIKNFFDIDKDAPFRMAPHLTQSHLCPNSAQKERAHFAYEVFSYEVAAGMAAQIELGRLPTVAKPTVDFIIKINKIFNYLNSIDAYDNDKHKRTFAGAAYQIQFLQSVLVTFQNIKAIEISTGKDVTETVTTFNCFQITINSILKLFHNIASTDVKDLKIRQFHQNELDTLFENIRPRETCQLPTPAQFRQTFSKLILDGLLNGEYLQCCEDNFDLNFISQSSDTGYLFEKEYSLKLPPMFIANTEKEFVLPTSEPLHHLSSQLLKAVATKHVCVAFKKYVGLIVPVKMKFNLVAPQDFVRYVETCENAFMDVFERSALGDGVGLNVLNTLKIIEHVKPCKCFPTEYFLKMFVHMRIHYALSYCVKEMKIRDALVFHVTALKDMDCSYLKTPNKPKVSPLSLEET